MMIMMTMMNMMAMVMAMIKRCGRARQVSRKICPRMKVFKNVYVKGSRDLYKVFWARSGLKIDEFSK